MNEIKQNTSQVTYVFLNDSDGNPVTGASNPTVYYSKAGSASTQLGAPTFSELDATNFPGVYMLTIPASLTDTLGELVISVSAAGTEKWPGKYQIVANTVKDAMDRLGVPAGASVVADIAARAAQTSIDALLTRLTAGRALLLDNLTNLDGSVNSAITAANNAKNSADGAKTSADTAATNATAAKTSADQAKAAAQAAETAIGNIPTAAQIADAVFDETAVDHNIADTFGNKINLLSTGGIDTQELADAIADQVNATLAGGSIPYTYTITRSDNGLPMADVLVWVTTDQAGTNIVAADRTDHFGNIEFMLDPGTYYFRQDKAGYKFTNPQVVEVSAEQTSAGTIGTLIDVQQIPIGPAVKTFTRNNEDFSKYPQETYPIAFDFAKALSADDYVVQVSVKAYDETQEVTGAIINGTSASGQAAIAVVQAGEANKSYKLLCKITSLKGLVREMKIRMDVKPE